ncbi:MAG: hypothetical protein ACP5QG_03735 [candidate division WOR-3 bacterium]
MEKLREKVMEALEREGYRLEGLRIVPPELTKENIRRMNTAAIEEARRLAGLEDKLLSTVAGGHMVDVERIRL